MLDPQYPERRKSGQLLAELPELRFFDDAFEIGSQVLVEIGINWHAYPFGLKLFMRVLPMAWQASGPDHSKIRIWGCYYNVVP
jgi:hypothetical protein